MSILNALKNDAHGFVICSDLVNSREDPGSAVGAIRQTDDLTLVSGRKGEVPGLIFGRA